MPPVPQNVWSKYVQDSGSGAATAITTPGARNVSQDTGPPVTQRTADRPCFALYCNGRILKYQVAVYGARPTDGYPLYLCFHGWGSSDDPIPNGNDGDWCGVFDDFYGTPVAKKLPCVFVAARGISLNKDGTMDTYDLHSQPESYVLLQQLIRNLLLPQPLEFKNKATSTIDSFVDSNRVYLLGFSAGGNGIYQLSTRLADRCCAVVAGSGHPEGAVFQNIANVPMLQQGGELDIVQGFNDVQSPRADALVKTDTTLNDLTTQYGKALYKHRTDIVKGGKHYDWATSDQVDKTHAVLSNLSTWQSKGTGAEDSTDMVINPENWVSAQLPRDPVPKVVIWNLAWRPPVLEKAGPEILPTGASFMKWQEQTMFYWLYILDETSTDFQKTDIIQAAYGKDTDTNALNWIKIQKPAAYLGFLINTDMMDYSKNVVVRDWSGKQIGAPVSLGIASNGMIDETLRARGDPKLAFSKMLYLQGSSAGWTVKVSDTLTVPIRANL